MANVKITDLTELSAAPASSDVVPLDDVSASTTKKITMANLFAYLSGGISTVLTSNLTASRALASSSGGKIEVSSVTATELGYVSGVTSAIQTQFNDRPSSPVSNLVYNGNFDLWDKGTSVASSADDSYPIPGWNFLTSTGTYTIAQTTSGAADGSRYFARITNLASGAYGGFVHFLEAQDSIALRNKVVSGQLKVKSSLGNGAFYIAVLAWTGTADSVTSDVVSSWATTPTLAASWAYEGGPISVSASTGWQTLEVENITLNESGANNFAIFVWGINASGGADSLDFSQVQLQIGTTTTAFAPRPVAQEELLANRRFWRLTGDASGNGPAFHQRAGAASEALRFWLPFPVKMRTTPTGSVGGTWALVNCTGPTLGNISPQGSSMIITSSASGLASAQTNGTDDYLQFDAEL